MGYCPPRGHPHTSLGGVNSAQKGADAQNPGPFRPFSTVRRFAPSLAPTAKICASCASSWRPGCFWPFASEHLSRLFGLEMKRMATAAHPRSGASLPLSPRPRAAEFDRPEANRVDLSAAWVCLLHHHYLLPPPQLLFLPHLWKQPGAQRQRAPGARHLGPRLQD